MSKHAETDNLYSSGISVKEKNESINNLKSPPQVYVGTHHHYGYYYGGAGLVLLVILLIVLV
jgi:hypothetical protein